MCQHQLTFQSVKFNIINLKITVRILYININKIKYKIMYSSSILKIPKHPVIRYIHRIWYPAY